ncbi:hypothetical protein LCGC14_1129470 [marine sediment metagenome]|uniref:Uncharacterized protein n=1 Tax=marine sediment metagenome TaxID=412755 RepID=A0A0F9PJU8_9ZZZZ
MLNLQKKYKEAGELFRDALFRVYRRGHKKIPNSEDLFTNIYSFEDLEIEDLMHLLFEEESPVTTQFLELLSKLHIDKHEYRQKLINFHAQHKKAAKRTISSIIAYMTPIEYPEEENFQLTFLEKFR